jgi:hypothetical protein
MAQQLAEEVYRAEQNMVDFLINHSMTKFLKVDYTGLAAERRKRDRVIRK